MENRRSPIVLGLTGQFGAGCTTVAEYLEERGFRSYSLSALVNQSLQERISPAVFHSLPKNELRARLQDEGNRLREEDAAILAKKIHSQIEKDGSLAQDIVIDSIRNTAEVEFLRSIPNFFLLALAASSKVRWLRKMDDYNSKDKDEFDKHDLRDKGEDEPTNGQQTEECIYMADIVVVNEDQLVYARDWDSFFNKVSQYVELMRRPRYRAPTYSELFMHMAYAISLKSSCSKRQVGALIVSPDIPNNKKNGISEIDNYVVATGYNDVPAGEQICAELGGRHRGGGRYCARDAYQRDTLRKMKFCPSCGNPIAGVPGSLETKHKCAKCGAVLPKDFVPGKLLDLCRSVHAEESAILQAAKLGSTSLRNSVLYTTTFPCLLCCKSIIDAGIGKVVYREAYPMENSVTMLTNCGVELETYEGVNAWAFDRMFRIHLS